MGLHAEHGLVVSTTRGPKVAIIGAGPAGLMAAEQLAKGGHRVTIYERMPSAGRKFLMAGRGGLNITHSEPLSEFLGRYSESLPSLQNAVASYPPQALIAWVESLGVPTIVGTSGRVFPKGLKASPLLRAWLRRLEGLGVDIRTRTSWTGWDEHCHLQFRDADGVTFAVESDATLLALGGASWPRLGSDGRWAEILSRRGVEIVPFCASNAAAEIKWSDHITSRFAGAPLKRIALRVGEEQRRGECVLTRSGLEGGAIYALTPSLRRALAHGRPVTLHLDLRPDLSQAEIAARLSSGPKKQSLSNWLRKTLSLPPVAIALLREPGEKQIPREASALAGLIKSLPLDVHALGNLERAISTSGGISRDAVDAHWMLRALPGVFVAGEMLDWEAPTGGYLLQGAFATGIAAARGLEAWLNPGSE